MLPILFFILSLCLFAEALQCINQKEKPDRTERRQKLEITIIIQFVYGLTDDKRKLKQPTSVQSLLRC